MTKMIQTLGLLSAAALISIPGMASAETVHVKVPFSFVFAGQEFASGDYNIQQSDSGLLLVQGAGRGAAVLSVPEGYTKPGVSAGVRFQKADDREYLVGVEVEGETIRSIPMAAPQERKLAFAH